MVLVTKTVTVSCAICTEKIVPRMPTVPLGVETENPLGFCSTIFPVMKRASPAEILALNSGLPVGMTVLSSTLVDEANEMVESSAKMICPRPVASVYSTSFSITASFWDRASSLP